MPDQIIATPYTRIYVAPLAISAILEAATRVGGKVKKCVCSLMGQVRDDGSVDITDAFANHVSEISEGVEKTHHDIMWQSRQKINPREIIIGWATTDLDLQSLQSISDWARTDQKSSKFVPKKRLPSPLLMLVRLPTTENDLQIKAYTKGPITNCLLKPAPFTITQNLPGMNLDAFAEPTCAVISTGMINQPVCETGKNPNIKKLDVLLQRIDRVMQIVENVINGKTRADADVGRSIYSAVSPSIVDTINSSLIATSQDNMLSLYMTNLVKLQLLVAEKLHLLFA